MAIVSISLNDKILEDIDGIQKELGFSGRSEVIRCALRLLIEENRQKEQLSGRINVIMIAVHDKKVEDMVTEIKHKFEDIIKTQIHSHIKEGWRTPQENGEAYANSPQAKGNGYPQRQK